MPNWIVVRQGGSAEAVDVRERLTVGIANGCCKRSVTDETMRCVAQGCGATSVLPNVTGGQVRQFSGFRRREILPHDLDLSTAEIDMMVTEATESLCSHVRAL